MAKVPFIFDFPFHSIIYSNNRLEGNANWLSYYFLDCFSKTTTNLEVIRKPFEETSQKEVINYRRENPILQKSFFFLSFSIQL